MLLLDQPGFCWRREKEDLIPDEGGGEGKI